MQMLNLVMWKIVRNYNNIVTNKMENNQSNLNDISSFYSEFGIREKSSFSGGFKFMEKPTTRITAERKEERKDLYKEFGLSRTPF